MSFLTRLYNWVSDRDNGIPIMASRMDGEFDNLVSAINTLYNNLLTGEWVAESNSFLLASTTSFNVIGVNLTSRYHVGRRLKLIHNGGVTVYATVLSVAFSTNTTVTVVTDDGTSLAGTITSLSYGLLSYVNPSYLDPRTRVFAYNAVNFNYSPSAIAAVPFDSTNADTLGEYDTQTYRFTAKHAGWYHVYLNLDVTQVGTAARYFRPIVYKNGGLELESTINDGISVTTGGRLDVSCQGFLNLSKGDILQAYFTSLNSCTINQGFSYNVGSRFYIMRMP